MEIGHLPSRVPILLISMVIPVLLVCAFPAGRGTVFAAQDVDISTPEIEAIRASLKERAERLFPFLDAGQVGIYRDGSLGIRTMDNLNLQERAVLIRLVEEDNRDRLALYREIAKANGFPDKANEVQAIFAETWREKAAPGWFLETDRGGWEIK